MRPIVGGMILAGGIWASEEPTLPLATRSYTAIARGFFVVTGWADSFAFAASMTLRKT